MVLTEQSPTSIEITAQTVRGGRHYSTRHIELGMIGSSTYANYLSGPPDRFEKRFGIPCRNVGDLVATMLARSGQFHRISVYDAAYPGTSTTHWWESRQSEGKQMGYAYQRALQLWQDTGVTYVAIMLGSNNVGAADSSAEKYAQDMAGLIGDLTRRGYKVILMQIGIRLDASGGTTPEQKLALIQQYNAVLPTLVDNKNVFLGDTNVFEWQWEHQETLRLDHIHQKDEGCIALSEFHSQAIEDIYLSLNP